MDFRIGGGRVQINDNIKKGAMLELAKREFYFFCRATKPDFYKKERDFLKKLCDDLQDFYESDKEDVLIVNLPP